MRDRQRPHPDNGLYPKVNVSMDLYLARLIVRGLRSDSRRARLVHDLQRLGVSVFFPGEPTDSQLL